MKNLKVENKKGETYYMSYEDENVHSDHVHCYPIGGGFEHVISLSIITLDVAIERSLSKIIVGFDESELGVYEGYIYDNDCWNGWLKPYLDEKQLKRFINDMTIEGSEIKYTLINDILKTEYLDEMQGDSFDTESTIIEFEGKIIKVWDVSNGLCWDEWKKEQLTEDEIKSVHK